MSKVHRKKLKKTPLLIIKIFLIFLILAMFLISNQREEGTFTNTINLLSVSKNVEGELIGGRVIPLTLEIKPGSGEIYINSNGILETDTQLSIKNSKEISCNIFELDCNKYDFYYSFSQDNLVLEGPSAGAAIGVLSAKTVLNEKIDDNVVITGSLSSGGVVGIVGGIPEKIELADDLEYKKILIPYFGTYNETKIENIEVVKVLDLVDVYNSFGEQKFEIEVNELEKGRYDELMEKLSIKLCERSNLLNENITEIKENSSQEVFLKKANENLNSSQIAFERESHYSAGSFCFGANNNLRSINELEKNYTNDQINSKLRQLEKEINYRYVELNSNEFKDQIKTINDFYVWLILNDRVYESREFVKNSLEDEELSTENIIENIMNQSNNKSKINEISNIVSQTEIDSKVISYSYALERLETVNLWGEFIVHEGVEVSFDETTLNIACSLLNNEIILKSQVLEQYELSFFDQEIEDLEKLVSNPINDPLCIYKTLELNGRIDTVISSIGLINNESKNFSEELFHLTKSRLSSISEDKFPLIPFIYFDYAEELYKQDQKESALLYTNYALSFSNLDLYLNKNEKIEEVIFKTYDRVVVNPVLVFLLLLILAFIG